MSFLIGLTAGVFGGLVGLGGGVIMIPLMVSFTKIGQHKAHGTSLVALVFTGIIGALTYARYGNVDVWAAVILAVAAILPARWGAKYCCDLPEAKLQKSFGIFLVFISLLFLLKPYLPSFFQPDAFWTKTVILLMTGMATGFLSGLMGVGGGAILIAGMVLLAGFDQHTAQGSSLLAMVLASTVGAFTHWQFGNVEKGLLPGLIPGIMIGTFAGGSFAHFLPETTLRIIFTVVLVCTGIRFIRASSPPCDNPVSEHVQ
jgi:uncharacterized membrane protein YfcA